MPQLGCASTNSNGSHGTPEVITKERGEQCEPEEGHSCSPPRPNWAYKREGSDRALGVTKTQSDAIKAGREVAKKDGVELVTHGRDGKIRDSDSYGNDPSPPKDKKN